MSQIIATFGIDWKILIVQTVNFGLLLALLWYLLYRPLTNLIESRRAQIIEGVANAERAAMMLKDSDAKKAEILTAASLEAEALMAGAREAAKKKEAAIMAEAQGKYDRALQEATLKGEEIERAAFLKSKEEIARLIVLGVEKTLTTNSGRTQ
jgi:F-type H+-transporting ATPase subunit b